MAAAGLFGKLNLKDEREILVLNAPAAFEPELQRLTGVAVRRRLATGRPLRFALVFATRKVEVDSAAPHLCEMLPGDAVLWFAYPKGSSRRYSCDFNRDTGWNVLGQLGFEPVRQVALDEDWSALRFRRVEFIKSVRRAPERAISAQGRRASEQTRAGRRAGAAGQPAGAGKAGKREPPR